MTSKELGKLAKEKKIKLEDLEIEDILKFGELGFLNPTLCEYFELSQKEVSKIRKQKGLTNSELENFIRDMIVLWKYIKDNHPHFTTGQFLMVVDGLIWNSIRFKSHPEFYEREVLKINWDGMDPNKEIELRKIDVKNRERSFVSRLYPNIDGLAQIYKEEYINPIINRELPRKKDKHITVTSTISRDSKISDAALKKAHYHCELNPYHETFIKRSNGLPYMEPHHLIPLEYQYLFEYSLDVEENIVSLCSNCHNEIHYGEDYKRLVKELYEERKGLLQQSGLAISLEKLYQLYDKESQEVVEV